MLKYEVTNLNTMISYINSFELLGFCYKLEKKVVIRKINRWDKEVTVYVIEQTPEKVKP